MDYQVSARKWRPQTFQEVIGQKHVTTSLTNAIRLKKIAQAYLFSGIRGVGKTTLARILAKGVNCTTEGETIPCNQCEQCLEIMEGRSVDVIEIDGASNTGVDDVRELRENVKYLPLRGRYKVYIIDEVHMLSNAAFNALLKTLEEPPPHLIFILATTESHKIPGTILSRCQHYAFRRMNTSEIVSQLRIVIEEKQTQFTERGLNLIARVADGSMRDALSLVDQAISFGGQSVSDEDLFMLLGRMDGITFHHLIQGIHKQDADAVLAVAKDVIDQGCDLRQFLSDWLEHLRNLIVAQNVSNLDHWVDLSKDEIDIIQQEAALFSLEAMQRLFTLFSRLLSEIRTAPQPGLLFEIALMKAILLADTQSIETVIENLHRLSTGQALPTEASGSSRQTRIQKPSPAATTPSIQKPLEPKGQTIDKPAMTQKTAAYAPPPSNAQVKEAAPDTSSQTESPKITVLARNKEGWQTCLNHMKKERPNIGSYLEEGTLDHFDSKEIHIAFPKNSAFLIPLLQKDETKQWLKDFLKKHFEDSVQLLLIEKEIEKKNQVTPNKTIAPPTHGAARFDSDPQHPLIAEVLRVMGGSIVETKRILEDED